MDRLEKLTPEQDALCDEVAEEALRLFYRPLPLDTSATEKWLAVAYGLFDMPVPQRIEYVASPYAALKLATELTGEKYTETDYVGAADAGWVALYDAFSRLGVLTAGESADVLALRDFLRCAWDTVLLDECAIVVRSPLEIHADDAGNMHRAGGPCILWDDGEEDYAWHGTWVTKRIACEPKSHSREEFDAITNTEQRRALCESAGWDWVSALLVASVIDDWTDPVTKLSYQLMRCSNGQMLLRQQSPRLKDGSQPLYIEPVHEELKTAQAARTWQATALTPDECEGTVLRYAQGEA